MVLVNFDTGEPLVPGDIVHDDSKPTEEHVLQIFDVYKKHFQHLSLVRPAICRHPTMSS